MKGDIEIEIEIERKKESFRNYISINNKNMVIYSCLLDCSTQ